MKTISRSEIELEVLKYYSERRVDVFSKVAPGMDKRNFKIQVFPQLEDYDAMGLRHLFRLVGTNIVEHTYPSDWWQALKERWLPKWALKISPIRYSEVVAKHIFPFLQEELGDEVVKVFVRQKEATNG